MPREPRQFEIGGIYHIVNRGYEKRRIFFDDRDYLRFIESLYYFNTHDLIKIREARLTKTTGPTREFSLSERKNQKQIVELLAFTLMPNHYHLIVREIVKSGISSFMRKLGNGYTGYFNTRYDRMGGGGIFQSRYKAIAMRDDTQLGTVFVYVHTNPVELKEPKWKDREVKDPKRALAWLEKYKWSSLHDYIGKPGFPSVTQRDFFIDFYGGNEDCYQAIKDWIMFKAGDIQFGPEI